MNQPGISSSPNDRAAVHRRSRPARRLVLALAVTAATTLGCGLDLHPGAAATVDGDEISQDSVDQLVSAACNFIEVGNEGSATPRQVGASTLRSSLTSTLVGFALTDKAVDADHLDLTVYSADVESADTTKLPDGLSDTDATLLDDFFYDLAQEQVQQATIGAHLKDDSVTTSADVSSNDVALASDYMTTLFSAADVDVNPGYGTWDGSVVNAGSGSLSDPVSSEAKYTAENASSGSGDVSGLPPTQVCG